MDALRASQLQTYRTEDYPNKMGPNKNRIKPRPECNTTDPAIFHCARTVTASGRAACHIRLASSWGAADLWESNPGAWVLPWAVLPEIDHLARRHLDSRTAALFMEDVCNGVFIVEYGERDDITRSAELDRRYASLGLGLVDGVVAAVAERLNADAIATLDVRHFGAIELAGAPRLLPRDA